MQITLMQRDVEKALVDYLQKQGINTEGKEVTFHTVSRRGGKGLQVDVEIFDMLDAQPGEEPTEEAEEAPVEVSQDEPTETLEEVPEAPKEDSEEPVSLFASA